MCLISETQAFFETRATDRPTQITAEFHSTEHNTACRMKEWKHTNAEWIFGVRLDSALCLFWFQCGAHFRGSYYFQFMVEDQSERNLVVISFRLQYREVCCCFFDINYSIIFTDLPKMAHSHCNLWWISKGCEHFKFLIVYIYFLRFGRWLITKYKIRRIHRKSQPWIGFDI